MLSQKDTTDIIEKMFLSLPQATQVEVMVSLYYYMYDGQKDKFLRETENA